MRKSMVVWSSVLLLCACQSEEGSKSHDLQERKDIELTRSEQTMVDEGNYFAFNLLKSVDQNEKEENYFISPLSASLALSMTTNGADGTTLAEMKRLLGFDAYTLDEMNGFYKKLIAGLMEADNTTQLGIANSIWVKEGFKVKDSFTQVNKDMYNARVEALDFSSANAVKTINQWCSDNTNGKIEKILEQIPSDASMYLINALYFKGVWKAKFDKANTTKGDFINEDESKSQVDMMKQECTLPYAAYVDLQIAEFPYGNEAFSMVVLLPYGDNTPEKLIADLTPEKWNEWMEQLSKRKTSLDVNFPKFKVEYERILNDDLKQLGMKSAFTNSADFSNMADEALCISMVKQKTFVEVNEEGTEAAAVTAVEAIATSAGPPRLGTFYMDHPFIYAIKEKSTGTILFIGKMGKM